MISCNDWRAWSQWCLRQLRQRDHNLHFKNDLELQDVDVVARVLRQLGCECQTSMPVAEQLLKDHCDDSTQHQRALVLFQRIVREYQRTVLDNASEHFALLRSRQDFDFARTWLEAVPVGRAVDYSLYEKYVSQHHSLLHRQLLRLGRQLSAPEKPTDSQSLAKDELPSAIVFHRETDVVNAWLRERLENDKKREQADKQTASMELHQFQPITELLLKLKADLAPHQFSLDEFGCRRATVEHMSRWLQTLRLYIESNSQQFVTRRLDADHQVLQDEYHSTAIVDPMLEKRIQEAMDEHLQRHFDRMLTYRLNCIQETVDRLPPHEVLKQLLDIVSDQLETLSDNAPLTTFNAVDVTQLLQQSFDDCSQRDLTRAKLAILIELQNAVKVGSQSILKKLSVQWRSHCLEVLDHHKELWSSVSGSGTALVECESLQQFLVGCYDTQQAVAALAMKACNRVLHSCTAVLERYQQTLRDEINLIKVNSRKDIELDSAKWRNFELPTAWRSHLPSSLPNRSECSSFHTLLHRLRESRVVED